MADDEDPNAEAENLLLQEFADMRHRLQAMEEGKLGYYAPDSTDEQRRAWVFEQLCNPEFDIDSQLAAMHKSAEWLKTGNKPRKSKLLESGEEAVILQLVSKDK